MTEMALPRGGRRAPEPPHALPTELLRRRLVDLAARRFSAPVTVVVAGAGFGKSTLLAQAIRANEADPRGVDAWLACEPDDGEAAHLASAIVASLDGEGSLHDPVERVLDALGRHAPVDVCLIIDDVHEVAVGSTGAALLADLVARLPPHAHVLLASRLPLPVPLARRRAAGQVVDIRADDLAFTGDELVELAALDGLRPVASEGHAGWPSLVRLAMSASPGAAPEFLWEQIVRRLDRSEQQALLALATLGWGTAAEVRRVADTDVVDLDALVAAVPLIREDADGRFSIHELWEDAVGQIFPPAALRLARQRALSLYWERDDSRRAGWSALRWADADAFRAAARCLVVDTLGALPIDIAERWLADAPARARGTPELRLLEIALRQARRHDDPQLLDDVIAVADHLAVGGEVAATATALTFGAFVAHSNGDEPRLGSIVERVRRLPEIDAEPIAGFLAGLGAAALASLRGDIDGALREVDELAFDEVPAPITEFAIRLQCGMLCLAGRADEAVTVSATLARSPSAYVRTVPAFVQWLAGDPSGYTAGSLDTEPGPGTNARWYLCHAMETTLVAASLGDTVATEKVRPTLEAFAGGSLDSRDRARIAVAVAARLIAEHDEAAAARTIAAHVDAHPASDRLGDVHLRWNLSIPYVCDARVRARWQDIEWGSSHARQKAAADALLVARSDGFDALAVPPAPLAVTSLPLPWSVELAARATAAGSPSGRALAIELCERAGEAFRDELCYAAGHGNPAVRRGAMALLETLPDRSRPPVGIAVLGDLEIAVDGERLTTADVRRRVRTLVEVLVLAGPLRRDQLMELMWPELDPTAAGRNLRVTLSRLRTVLDAGRSDGTELVLRIDGDQIAIAAAPAVEIDLRQFQADVAEADAARRDGDPGQQLVALDRACSRWRGEPFADLADMDGVAGEVEGVRRLLASTALRLGELQLVGGRFDDAAASAQRVLEWSRYDERAHRLAIAAHLQRDDCGAAAEAAAGVVAMLDELGVDPEPATRMLLNQAAARCP